MPLSFMKDTVIVLRAPIVKINGMEHRDWENASSHVISNVQITAQQTTQVFEGRVTNVSDKRTLRARFDADIAEGDRVIWNEDVYEVNGEVFHTKSPRGRVSSTRCTLIRWEG